MKRILAHKIVYKGETYPMSVVTIDCGRVVSILPYEQETDSTVFVSGVVEISGPDDDVVVAVIG